MFKVCGSVRCRRKRQGLTRKRASKASKHRSAFRRTHHHCQPALASVFASVASILSHCKVCIALLCTLCTLCHFARLPSTLPAFKHNWDSFSDAVVSPRPRSNHLHCLLECTAPPPPRTPLLCLQIFDALQVMQRCTLQ